MENAANSVCNSIDNDPNNNCTNGDLTWRDGTAIKAADLNPKVLTGKAVN